MNELNFEHSNKAIISLEAIRELESREDKDRRLYGMSIFTVDTSHSIRLVEDAVGNRVLLSYAGR